MRQALAFGLRAALWGTVALAWPLVLSLLIANATATIILYLVAIVLDVVLFTIWLRRALRYSKRASRGEAFSLGPAQRQTATRGIPVKH